MVKKLMKHELAALFRVLLFFMIGAVVFGVLGRAFAAVHSVREENEILTFLFVMLHVIAVISLVVAAYAVGISRFYRTLFTGEGYLTLSLPATASQILWAKLLSSLIAVLASAAVSALTVSLYLIGWDEQTMQTIAEAFTMFWDVEVQVVFSDPLYLVEAIIQGVLSLPVMLLLVYTGMSLGQLFSNRRKFFMFLVFFGGYVLLSVFSQLCLTPILEAAETVSGHLSGWIIIVLTAATDVGCFFLVRYILKNKINLTV